MTLLPVCRLSFFGPLLKGTNHQLSSVRTSQLLPSGVRREERGSLSKEATWEHPMCKSIIRKTLHWKSVSDRILQLTRLSVYYTSLQFGQTETTSKHRRNSRYEFLFSLLISTCIVTQWWRLIEPIDLFFPALANGFIYNIFVLISLLTCAWCLLTAITTSDYLLAVE